MSKKDIHSNHFSRERSNGLSQSAILIVVLALVFSALPALYAWVVRYMLRRNMRRLRAGDIEPLFSSYADDVRFVFPGENSWKADLRGKDEVKRWVQRFMRVGLQLEPHEILVEGPPWNTSICLRFTDHYTTPDGNVVYSNQGTIFGKIVWGKMTYYEVHEDTQKSAEFDKYLALHESTSA